MSDTVVLTHDPTDNQQRRRRFRVRKGRVIAVIVIAILVTLAMGWLLSWQSPVPIRAVSVVGAEPASQQEIIAAAAIPIGTPLKELDVDAVAARVDALPGIDSTALVLDRPWTVEIDVVERFPFAAVANGDQWTVVDVTGRAIRDVNAKPTNLPELTTTPDRWPGVLTALAALSDDVRGRLKSATVGDDGTITMVMKSDATVLWGTADQSADKARALAALVQYDARGYNVSVPQRPAMSGDAKLPKANQIPPEEPSY